LKKTLASNGKRRRKKKAKKHIFDLAVKDTRLHFIFLEKRG
jgi:hypothetical protein